MLYVNVVRPTDCCSVSRFCYGCDKVQTANRGPVQRTVEIIRNPFRATGADYSSLQKYQKVVHKRLRLVTLSVDLANPVLLRLSTPQDHALHLHVCTTETCCVSLVSRGKGTHSRGRRIPMMSAFQAPKYSTYVSLALYAADDPRTTHKADESSAKQREGDWACGGIFAGMAIRIYCCSWTL